MAFTKAYARILADMLTGDTREAFRVVCGKIKSAHNISEQAILDLIDLELVRRDRTTDRVPKDVVLLTAKGRKAADYV